MSTSPETFTRPWATQVWACTESRRATPRSWRSPERGRRRAGTGGGAAAGGAGAEGGAGFGGGTVGTVGEVGTTAAGGGVPEAGAGTGAEEERVGGVS